MGEVVNLRTVRKQRGRAEARRRAAKRDGDAAEASGCGGRRSSSGGGSTPTGATIRSP